MITFWIITAQRLAANLHDPRPSAETKAWFSTDLAVNVLLYLGFIALTVRGIMTAFARPRGAWPAANSE